MCAEALLTKASQGCVVEPIPATYQQNMAFFIYSSSMIHTTQPFRGMVGPFVREEGYAHERLCIYGQCQEIFALWYFFSSSSQITTYLVLNVC